MDFFIAVLTSGIAAFIWLFLFRIIDHFKPERWGHILFFFALGGLSVLLPYYMPALLEIQAGWDNIFLDHLVNVAFVEETGKLFFLVIGMFLFPKLFSDAPNFLIYGASVGIGFGFVENVMYAMQYGSLVLHFRDIISLSLHAFCTGIIAYGLYKFKSGKPGLMLLWFLSGVLIHALYNTFLEIGEEFYAYALISYLVYLMAIELFSMMLNNAINLSEHFTDHVPFPAKAIRTSMTFTFILLFFIFMVMYVFEFGMEGVGAFLFLTAPLLFLVYVTVNRFSSLVLVKGKTFPISPSFPFIYGGMDLGVPGMMRARITIKGLPYDEWPYVSRINKETHIRPINRNFDYFGNHAIIRISGKVYGKNQIIFYPLDFIQSDDPVNASRFYYLLPKFSGETEKGNYHIVALVSREQAIDSSTEDAGRGGFCAWVYLEKEPEVPTFRQFISLLRY